MEEQLVGLLANTQSPNTTTRSQAEESLQQLWIDENFPLALVSIASHDSVQTEIRQSALLTLKSYVLATWSPSLEEFKGQVVLGDEPKARVRDCLFSLATSETADRKTRNAASYVVSKIASADFPDQWGGLLDTLLELIPQASDTRLHGALKVLAELVQDGLDEGQFFQVAQNLVNVLHTVASNDQRKPVLRALAISVLKECFTTLEVVIEAHRADVKAFVEKALTEWIPTFLSVLNAQLGPPPDPATTTEGGSSNPYHGLVALKVQVARVRWRLEFR